MNDFTRGADDRSLWLAVFGDFFTLFGLIGVAVADVQHGLFLVLGGVLLAWQAVGKRRKAPGWLFGVILLGFGTCMVALLARLHI